MPGQVKLKLGGSHAGHNGLKDIHAQLGSGDYWRLRIGIGHPGRQGRSHRLRAEEALARAPRRDREEHRAGARRGLDLLLDGDMERATMKINARPPRPKPRQAGRSRASRRRRGAAARRSSAGRAMSALAMKRRRSPSQSSRRGERGRWRGDGLSLRQRVLATSPARTRKALVIAGAVTRRAARRSARRRCAREARSPPRWRAIGANGRRARSPRRRLAEPAPPRCPPRPPAEATPARRSTARRPRPTTGGISSPSCRQRRSQARARGDRARRASSVGPPPLPPAGAGISPRASRATRRAPGRAGCTRPGRPGRTAARRSGRRTRCTCAGR